MLISVNELSSCWGVSPRSVLHIGAHQGEEGDEYERFGWDDVTWVEANPELHAELVNRFSAKGHRVINAALWHTTGEILSLSVTSNGQSSSLLKLGVHLDLYPDITVESETPVVTTRLDDLLTTSEAPDFCNIDIQGAELAALRGFGDLLQHLSAIYTEVNRDYLYVDGALVEELDEFLGQAGFTRVTTRWLLGYKWGDALYLRSCPSVTTRLRSLRWAIPFYFRQVAGVVLRSLSLSHLPTVIRGKHKFK
jgi:FkbM family methyltransferase